MVKNSGFQERVMEAARIADGSQYTTYIIPPLLIDIISSKCMIFE